MGSRIHIFFCLLLFLVVTRDSLAQTSDTAFRRQHSLNRPDSILVKDTVLFPEHNEFSKARFSSFVEKYLWADSGSVSYAARCDHDSAHITLRADHSFIFRRSYGVLESFSIGRWWLVKDSLICLNWFDMQSMEMAKRPKIDILHHTVSDPVFTYLPTRIDHWWFVRRGSQLVPY